MLRAGILVLGLCLLACSDGDSNLKSDTSDDHGDPMDPNATMDSEERLLIDLFAGYQRLALPVRNITNNLPVAVHVGMQFVLLINVDERNQIMHSNVWMTFKWNDEYLSWDIDKYEGINQLRIPCHKVWLPDIVLYNNADGQYIPSYESNVYLTSDGNVSWVPPALYKSTCIMDVEHFPFDQQKCNMTFKSWTYDKSLVKLDFKDNINAVDLSQFYYSSIWDIVECPARIYQKGATDQIDFTLVLRRKTLFYTFVLIVPSVLMAMVVVVTFYLPTDAGEKIGLSILNLLSVTVFLNLLMKILPSTSKSVPLLAKYLLIIFIMNCLVILISVMTVNVNFRSASTHRMPNWVRRSFLGFLPKLLLMRRLILPSEQPIETKSTRIGHHMTASPNALPPSMLSLNFVHHPLCRHSSSKSPMGSPVDSRYKGGRVPPLIKIGKSASADTASGRPLQLTEDHLQITRNLAAITKHIKDNEESAEVAADWKFVGLVLDRLLLYSFTGMTIGFTLGLFLNVPHNVPHMSQRELIQELGSKYNWAGFRHMGDQLSLFDS